MVLGALNVAELALFGKGLRSASLTRTGHLEHAIFFLHFLVNFYNFLLFFVLFVQKWHATRPVSNRLLYFYRTL